MHTAILIAVLLTAAPALPKDQITTSSGPLGITFIAHATLTLEWNGKIIQVDPCGKLTDYTLLPKADLVLVTHEHPDHLDPKAIETVSKEGTVVVCTAACAKAGLKGTVMKNGDRQTVGGIAIEAVPAYNLSRKRPDGELYHPKGAGNGYVLSFGDTRVYIAGDTEGVPEMGALKDIGVAFLPMNLPYTMTPEEVAGAARSFLPKILYPYHTGETEVSKVVALLKDTPAIDVRVRAMK